MSITCAVPNGLPISEMLNIAIAVTPGLVRKLRMTTNPHYLRNRLRDEQRRRVLHEVTKAVTGATKIRLLSTMESRERASKILGALTSGQQIEYFLYNSYRRRYLN